jgi:glycosyltransferase involved in cell wall biosynthesis
VVSSVAAEQVRDGEDGFVLNTEDPATYAERLLRLMDDPATARSMGQRARRRVVEHSDAALTADRLAIFLRSIHRPAEDGVRLQRVSHPAPVGE